MDLFNKDLLDSEEQIRKENKEILKKSGEMIINMFNGGEPKNINPLIEIPESQMKLYGYSSFFDKSYFDAEEKLMEYIRDNKCDMLFGGVCIIEYLGTVAGCNDVIRQTYSDGDSRLVTAATEEYISTYSERRSYHQGRFVWESNHGNLRVEYNAFKKRGIVLNDDIYKRYDDEMANISMRMKEIKACSMGEKNPETIVYLKKTK